MAQARLIEGNYTIDFDYYNRETQSREYMRGTSKTAGGIINVSINSGALRKFNISLRHVPEPKRREILNYLDAKAWQKVVLYLETLKGTIDCILTFQGERKIEDAADRGDGNGFTTKLYDMNFEVLEVG